MMNDEYYMLEAIKEGEKGRVTAPPNPWVGAIIVKDGKIIGRGYHHEAGQPHAEIMAMRSVSNKDQLIGSTLYCTLEPCSHHGRTGPCCKAVMKASITRCVIGVLDPDSNVSGKGMAYMRKHGIEISFICTELATKSLAPYLHHRQTGRPYVVIKMATTMDGMIACEDKTSQWITGSKAREESQHIRANSQAIIIGSGTALIDNPRLTVRGIDTVIRQPLRVVLDRRGRLNDARAYHLFDPNSISNTLILTESNDTFEWIDGGVSVLKKENWSIIDVLDELGKRGILQVMVEGGSTLHTSFIEQGLVNQIILFIGSTIFGMGAIPWLTSPICKTISDAKFWSLESVEKVNNDVKLIYLFKYM